MDIAVIPRRKLDYGFYEPWMRDPIVALFAQEYGSTTEAYGRYFDRFFFHPVVGEGTVRVVALEGETVAGFVGFTPWPYRCNGRDVRCWQAVSAILDSRYRGQGVYPKMLRHLDANAGRLGIELVIGFPIRPIRQIYLRQGWSNVVNLQWYVKPVNPLGRFFPMKRTSLLDRFSAWHEPLQPCLNEAPIHRVEGASFGEWRRAWQETGRYYACRVESGTSKAVFSLKTNHRRGLHELVIGRVETNTYDPSFLRRAVRELTHRARWSFRISFLSYLCNPRCTDRVVLRAFQENGYFAIPKDVDFVLRAYQRDETFFLPSAWGLDRSDADTW